MDIDERLDRIAANLDILARMHIDAERAAEDRAAKAAERAAAAEASIAEAQKRAAEAAAEAQRRFDEVGKRFAEVGNRFAESDERIVEAHDRITEVEQRTAEAQERATEASARHEREMAAIRAELRRGVRLSIQEARAERCKRQKLEQAFDEKMTQLAAAQLLTEEKLQRFLEHRSGNGNS